MARPDETLHATVGDPGAAGHVGCRISVDRLAYKRYGNDFKCIHKKWNVVSVVLQMMLPGVFLSGGVTYI